MRAVKPFAGFALLLVLFAAGGTVAQAASKRRVDQTFTLGTLRDRAGYPKPGSRVVLAGTVRSRFGRGTIVLALTVTVRPSATSFSFKGTSRAFYPRGTTSGGFTGTGTLQRGGRLTLAGHGRYTGGTLFGRARKGYSFSGTAPSPPPPPPPTPPVPCAVPAGWQVVARDSEVVVIEPQAFSEIQEYRYCNYSRSALGFQLLVRNDDSGFLAGAATFSTVDGVALAYILYHSTFEVDSPGCVDPTMGDSEVYAVDTSSGHTSTLAHGRGGITSVQFSPPGVGAWILTANDCPLIGNQRQETLMSFSVHSGAVTTLDTGDPPETTATPPSLGNLQIYPCGGGCPTNTAVVAWTHDGTWRYEPVG